MRARSLVYKVCRDCLTCRRLFSKTCIQKMADLPEFRVDFDKRPFNHVSGTALGPSMSNVVRVNASDMDVCSHV